MRFLPKMTASSSKIYCTLTTIFQHFQLCSHARPPMGDSDQSDDEAGSLRRAFEHVKAMREENATLRENFENVS